MIVSGDGWGDGGSEYTEDEMSIIKAQELVDMVVRGNGIEGARELVDMVQPVEPGSLKEEEIEIVYECPECGAGFRGDNYHGYICPECGGEFGANEMRKHIVEFVEV